MHFSEDDLKEALRRKDPGPGFTQRVMARIGQQQEADAPASAAKTRLPWWRWVLQAHPTLPPQHAKTARAGDPGWRLAGALAALVLIIGGGLGYQQYQRVQEQKRVEAQRAEQAKEQLVQALKITNAKLNHVFRRVSEPSAAEPKIRRQTL